MSGLVSGLRESRREVVVTVTTTPQPRRVICGRCPIVAAGRNLIAAKADVAHGE